MFAVFSFLGRAGSIPQTDPSYSHFLTNPPSVKLSTNKLSYRPGDTLLATITIIHDHKEESEVLLESLLFEIKGIEKLDPQWLLTDEAPHGSNHRRGEHTILESSPVSITTDILFKKGVERTYLIRLVLPEVLPPSYKGTAVRYLYYIGINMQWSVTSMDNGNNGHDSPKILLPPLEIKKSLNIWMMANISALTIRQPRGNKYAGIIPQSAIQVEIYWREKNDGNDWVKASSILSMAEDNAFNQSTESAIQSPEKENIAMCNKKKMEAQSLIQIPQDSKQPLLCETSIPGFGSRRKPLQLIIPDPLDYDSGEDSLLRASEARGLLSDKESLEIWKSSKDFPRDKDAHRNFDRDNGEQESRTLLSRSPSGAYAKGRSYNIKMNDRVLACFYPKNPDSLHYYGDVVGGVFRFFHHEGQRRCLEISAVLETREVLNPAFIHPSRKNSRVITKVQADYYEVVADKLQTHFSFSIPLDGPPSFGTPYVTLEWVLRFEFITASNDVDLSKHEHPLLIGERERGEWAIPILVHAPLPRTQKSNMRRERPCSPSRDL